MSLLDEVRADPLPNGLEVDEHAVQVKRHRVDEPPSEQPQVWGTSRPRCGPGLGIVASLCAVGGSVQQVGLNAAGQFLTGQVPTQVFVEQIDDVLVLVYR